MPSAHHLDAALIDAALEIRRRRLAEKHGESAFVSVETPGQPSPMYAEFVFDGPEAGVSVAFGPEAAEFLLDVLDLEQTSKEEAAAARAETIDAFGIAYVPLKDAPSEVVGLLRLAGREFAADEIVPCFKMRRAGKRARPLNRDERATLLYVAKALLAADDADRLDPFPMSRGGSLQLLVADGDATAPDVDYHMLDLDAPSGVRAVGACSPPPEIDVATIPRIGGVYGVHVRPADGERDGFDIFVVDFKSESLVQRANVDSDDPAFLSEVVWCVLDGDAPSEAPGLPDEIRFTSPALLRAMTAALGRAGVKAVGATKLPPLERAIELHEEETAEAEKRIQKGSESQEPPADDDLDAWDGIESATGVMIGVLLKGRGLPTAALADVFFGDREFAELVVAEPNRFIDANDALIEWLFARHLDPDTGRTLLEEMIERTTSPAHRAIFEARRAGGFTLFRVEALIDDFRVVARDLVADETREILDGSLHDHANVGDLFVAKYFRVGAFTFIRGRSSLYASEHEAAVRNELIRAGADPDLKNLAQRQEIAGRIYSFVENAL